MHLVITEVLNLKFLYFNILESSMGIDMKSQFGSHSEYTKAVFRYFIVYIPCSKLAHVTSCAKSGKIEFLCFAPSFCVRAHGSKASQL